MGRRRAAAARAPAWHGTASATGPTTAGTAPTRTQHSAVSIPRRGPAPRRRGWAALRGAKLGEGSPRASRGGFAEGWYQPSPLQGPPCPGEGRGAHPWVTRLSLPAESFTLCSFEQNLCGWEVEAGQPAWQRSSSLSLGTARGIPGRDHSTNSRAGGHRQPGEPTAGPRSAAAPGRPCPPAPGVTGLGLRRCQRNGVQHLRGHHPGWHHPGWHHAAPSRCLPQVFSSTWATARPRGPAARHGSAVPLSRPATPAP